MNRTRKIAGWIAGGLLAGACAFGQSISLKADVQTTGRPLDRLTFMKGATPTLRVYLYENGLPYTSIGNHTGVFYFAASPVALTFRAVTNSSKVTASGYFVLNVRTQETATAGVYWYTVIFRNAAGLKYFGGTGRLDVVSSSVLP